MRRDYRLWTKDLGLKFLGPLSLVLCLWSLCCYSYDYNVELKPKFNKIKLTQEAIKTLGIKTKEVREEVTEELVKTTGQIEEIPNNKFEVNSPVNGKVTSILVNLGDEVSIGQSLATIQSTDISKLQAEVSQLSAELELAKSNYEREKSLFEQGISAKKEYQASESNLRSVEARLSASESNLKILTTQVGTLMGAPNEQGTFTLKSQKPGVIVERNITVGQVVNPNQILFYGVDLSNVWASGDIYERDVSKVALGQKVNVTLDGMPDKQFEGKLTYIGSIINKETRTLPVKATLENKEGLLKPGAFLQFVIETEQSKKSIVIPRTALVETDSETTEKNHEHTIYIQENHNFVPKKIKVESHDSNTVEISDGLTAGEIIVTEGAYQLQYADNIKEHKTQKNINSFFLFIIILIVFVLFFSFYLIKRKKKFSSD